MIKVNIGLNVRNIAYKQSGAALITVLVMVFIIMAIISNITVQNYRTIRRLINQSYQDQAVAILRGTVDFARAGLATSGATSKADTLNDIWAQPIPKSPILNDIMMSGYLQDEQSKFNINDLVSQGMVNENVLNQFTTLLNYLNIPSSLATSIAYYMASPKVQEGIMQQYTNGSPAYRPAGRTLVDLSELLYVKGVQPVWISKLNQYVTAIPQTVNTNDTNNGNNSNNNDNNSNQNNPNAPTGSGTVKINVNTASAEVISAKSGIPLPIAQRMVTMRSSTPFLAFGDIKDFLTKSGVILNQQTMGGGKVSITTDTLSVDSNYFTLHGVVLNGDFQFRWIAMLYRQSRNGAWPVILWQHPE